MGIQNREIHSSPTLPLYLNCACTNSQCCNSEMSDLLDINWLCKDLGCVLLLQLLQSGAEQHQHRSQLHLQSRLMNSDLQLSEDMHVMSTYVEVATIKNSDTRFYRLLNAKEKRSNAK